MKRISLGLALLLALSVGKAGADYLIVKIDLEKFKAGGAAPGGEVDPKQPGGNLGGPLPGGANLGMPNPGGPGQGFPGKGAGIMGGPNPAGIMGGPNPAGIMGNPGGNFMGGPKGNNNPPPKSNVPEGPAHWLSVVIELKTKTKAAPLPGLVEIEHKFGKKTYVPGMPPAILQYVQLNKESPLREFERKFKKELKETTDAQRVISIAKWALAHGLTREYHSSVEELRRIDPKHPVLLNYSNAVIGLKAPFTQMDPALEGLLADLKTDNFRMVVSEQGHYALLTKTQSNPANDVGVKRRLVRMEETLENFFHWFALHPETKQPTLPKRRLLAVLVDNADEFDAKHAYWGGVDMHTDGFTPRRDNLMVLSARPLAEGYDILQKNTESLRGKMNNIGRDEILSGQLWDRKEARMASTPYSVLQLATLVLKVLEDESERNTISHEATRQLFAATGVLPGNVFVPEWAQFGLASYFETPHGALYSGPGLLSWTHLIDFKYLNKTRKLDPKDVLQGVLTDRFFNQARKSQIQHRDDKEDDKLALKAREDRMLARSMSWALVYHLMQQKKLPNLMKYAAELGQLPRDLDLDENAQMACLARAFPEVASTRNANQIDAAKLKAFAADWFAKMEEENLEVAEMVNEGFRVRHDAAIPRKQAAPVANPGQKGPGGIIGPNPGFPGGINPGGINPGGINPGGIVPGGQPGVPPLAPPAGLPQPMGR